MKDDISGIGVRLGVFKEGSQLHTPPLHTGDPLAHFAFSVIENPNRGVEVDLVSDGSGDQYHVIHGGFLHVSVFQPFSLYLTGGWRRIKGARRTNGVCGCNVSWNLWWKNIAPLRGRGSWRNISRNWPNRIPACWGWRWSIRKGRCIPPARIETGSPCRAFPN